MVSSFYHQYRKSHQPRRMKSFEYNCGAKVGEKKSVMTWTVTPYKCLIKDTQYPSPTMS